MIDPGAGRVATLALPEGHSLRDLDYDGRWVTGSLHRAADAIGSTEPAGIYLADTATGEATVVDRTG